MSDTAFRKRNRSSPKVRLSPFWKFQLAGWSTFFIATLPLKWVVLGSIQSALIVSAYREGMGFLTTWGMREVYRRIYRKGLSTRALCALVLSVSLIAAVVQTYLCLQFHDVFDFEEEKIFKNAVVFGIFYFRIALCLSWSFLYFAIRIWLQDKHQELQMEKERGRLREAELQMLRAQMNPHFLFNALNTIQAEIGLLNSGLRAKVQALSDYLRYSLENRNREQVELRQEVEAIRSYLAVEEARFPEELQIEWSIEENALDTLVPGVLIQPLVENAIKYGRRTSTDILTVNLSISCPDETSIRITVSNTGRWVTPQSQPTLGGVGLENVRQRLALLYPEKDCLHIREENGWVTVEIQIPVKP